MAGWSEVRKSKLSAVWTPQVRAEFSAYQKALISYRKIHGANSIPPDLKFQSPAKAARLVEKKQNAVKSIVSQRALRRFTAEIMHGDEVHRQWLREAVEAFIAGQPVPRPL
jgi:hypothetical protein